ncbi:phosphopentomutase [Loktanella sp. SALINAS62]|uniref:phosphopentomutase n=1 Tax=Loktanella sp. SALINAS62 TaxID=2706124 RepID=UPI001B8A8DE1|nr:phosphopentomutase [Loktanella sp. SALINAS62]MBS1303346.1 phosphopentomutase [Loktanella sp. SALINAS62]
MTRAFLVVIDSVGIGGAPDADQFFNGTVPDTGANTIAHIADGCAALDRGPLALPTLDALGLGRALTLASGAVAAGLDATPTGAWGAATEISRGKDTPSGHWELAGVPVPWDWHYFPDTQPAYPDDLTVMICQAAGTGGILGNRHASGTQVIDDEGARHIATGWPIVYTSADSVLQIAAHEDHFGLDRLMKLCADLAPTLHAMRIGRVIARPFVGSVEDGFKRTPHRKDFAIAPPSPTICDDVKTAGHPVHAVGKIGDIFSMRGIDDVRKGADRDLMRHLNDLVETAADGAFVFANFVEFDSEYGHRRNIPGYAAHLEWFDAALADLLPRLRDGDLLIVTADHGNDPSWIGTDHTRERVPVLVHGMGARALGPLAFVDVAATISDHLGVPHSGPGRSFL